MTSIEYIDDEGHVTDKVLIEMFSPNAISPAALGQIERLCMAFWAKAKEILDPEPTGEDELFELGHGFWFSLSNPNLGFKATSERHGDTWDKLHKAACSFDRVSLEVDEDGRIQFIG